jgi:hypothetical protein
MLVQHVYFTESEDDPWQKNCNRSMDQNPPSLPWLSIVPDEDIGRDFRNCLLL